MKALVLVLLLVPSVALARPPAMIVGVLQPHVAHRFSASVLGSALSSYDGSNADAVLGGALALSWLNGRDWPDAWWWWAFDVRVGVLARNEGAHYDVELPIDLFVKGGVNLVASGSGGSGSGYPVEIIAALPIEPYFGVGGTLLVSFGGDVRVGPLALFGVQWWLGDRAAIFAELAAGALFGGPNVFARIGGNVGVSVTL